MKNPKTWKRILSMIMVFAMVISFVPPVATHAAGTKTIYMNPGPWDDDTNAWFEVWAWDSSQVGAWYSFTDDDADGIYEAEVASGITGIKILRKGPSHASKQWQSWNDTGDVTVPADKNIITITGWSDGNYSWSVYTAPHPLDSGWVILGSFNEWNATQYQFMRAEAGATTASVSVELAAGTTYQFKLMKNGGWYGYDQFASDEHISKAAVDGNAQMTTTIAGIYVFTMDLNNQKLSVTYPTPAAPDAEISGTEGANGWYTNANLVAPEGYQIAASENEAFGLSLSIPDGEYDSFTYVLQNAADDTTTQKTYGPIKVDGTAPAVSDPTVQLDTAAGKATITVEAEDNTSGVASYELTGAANSFQGNTFTVTGLTWNEEYTLTLKVTDNAGNIATESISLIRSCDHSTTRGEDNGDGTHKLVCANTACNYVVEESETHTFASSTGKCGQCQADMEEVATVTISGVTTYHQTLSDAVTEAQNGTTTAPATIKLLTDINLGESSQEITSGVFTIDLNGKTLSGSELNSSVLDILGGDVTITDNGEGGAITGTDSGVSASYGGTVTINGGTITGVYGVYVSKGIVTINGGTITGEYGVTAIISTVTITGGTISGTEYDLYNSHSTITLGRGESGIGATFPGGLTVDDTTTLDTILGEGAAYWQDGKMIVLADGLNEIAGGDVTIKAECTHENTEKTYQDIGNGFHTPSCDYCGAKLESETSQHTTVKDENKATCQKQAVCDLCGASYGEADDTNHDETVAFNNGFCPNCDEYEPAVLNNGVYEISNAGQLYWFAQKVNSGETSINGKLTKDIVIEDNIDSESGRLKSQGAEGLRDWNPIGNNNCQYSGTFDGGDHTVSGLYLNDTNKDHVGLFGYVAAGGTIQNVSIEKTYFRGKNHVGGVVGYNEGNVKNCHNEGEVCSTDSNGDAGGVVGFNKGTVQHCSNSGRVGADSDMNSHVGGVVGYNEGTVEDCSNTGDATGTSNKNIVGGVVGLNKGTVRRCFNTSMLCNSGEAPISLGGVVGYNDGEVQHCYNTGEIENYGTALDLTQNDPIAVGGVVGLNEGTVQHCYNTGAVTSTEEGMYLLIGDVVGSNRNTVQNCFYQAERENDSIGGTTFKTDAQFASGEVAYLLGAPFGQNIDNGKPDQPYPNFTGAAVHYGYTSCGDTAMRWTNTRATQTKPEHTDSITYAVNATDSGKHDKTYDCCGTVVTEVHSFDETTGKCTFCGTDCAHNFNPATGKCDVCQADIAVATVTIGETTTYSRTLDDAIQAVANCTAADRAVVKLLTDIDIGSNDQEITSGIFTIDLNGKTLSNSATREAVLYIQGSNTIKPDVTITGGTISSSQSTGACADNGIMTITDCTITGNIYGVYIDLQCTVTITDCTITSNKYGVHTGLLSTVTITDCTITSIDTDSSGVCTNSSIVTIEDSKISGGRYGVYAKGGIVTIKSGEIDGEGLYGVYATGGNVTIEDGEITGCNDSVHVEGGTVNIKGGKITDSNTGVNVKGGNVTITGGTITGNNVDLNYSSGTLKLTLAEGATEGATFPKGLKVSSTTLNAILAEGAAYWQGDKMILPADDATAINGSDVTIKAECKHDESKLSYEDNQDSLTHKVSCSCGYLLEEGKEHTFDSATGKCGQCQADLAVVTVTIGETTTYSWTLDDAIHAVEDCAAADKAVVKLLTDINLGSNYQEITSGEFTIDLNGFELSGSATSYGVLYILGNDTAKSDVTITDSGEGGIISSSQKNGVYATGSTVTIIGGTITGSEYGVYANSDSTVNIDGGTIIGEDGGINITSSSVSITGGTITDSSMSSYGVFVTLGKVTITGGEISGGMYGITAGSRCTVSIQGGEISGTYAVLSVNQCSVTITGGALTGELKIVGSLKLGLGQNGSGATFLGGLRVSTTTLNAILAEGAAYWQDTKMILPADDATSITGGDVTVKAECKHDDQSKLSYEDNQDGNTHKVSCACGYIGEENHTFNADTGKCAFCDAACDHATKNADGNCGICGYNPIASFTVSGESSWNYDPNHDVALTLAHILKEGYQAEEVYYTHDKENAPKYTESAISLGKGWNAGTYLYTMKVYVDGFFKTVNYTAIVSKVNPNAALFVFSAPTGLTYNGYGKVASVVLAEGLNGCGQLTVCYRAEGTTQWTNDAPVEPGTYEVGVRVGSGTNFNAPYENRPITSENWTFTIEKKTIKAEDFVFTPPGTLIYDGQAKEAYLLPIDNVSAAGMGIFTYKYRDSEGNLLVGEPVNVGTYTLVIDVTEGTYYKAVENLTSENWTFTIEKAQTVINVDDTPVEVTYGDNVELPEATSNFGTVTCDLTAADMVNAGTYNVIYSVADSDNYYGAEKTVTVIINPKPLTEGDVELLGELTYSGSEQMQMITVPDGVTYEISGNKATNAGTYELTVTASGNYTGSVTKQWSIGKLDIFDANVVIDDCLEYNGAPQTAVILQVNAGVVVLNEETDYTVSGNVRTNAGSYELTVTGTGNFTGTAKAYWFIQKRPVNLVAEGQTISYGSTISQNAYTIDGLVEGHTAVITLVSSTDQVTSNGEVQIVEVEIMADGVDVTENYITGLAAPAKLVITPDASQIEDLTIENATSSDQEKLEKVLKQLENADSLTEDWEDLLENVQKMLERIENAKNAANTPNTEKVEDVTAENVQRNDKQALKDAKADLNDVLNEYSGNYTNTEKQEIQADIDRITDALKVIENAEKVEKAIDELPEAVEPDDDETARKILDAKSAFDTLTDREKTLVDAAAKEKLDALMEALTAYRLVLGGGGIYTKENEGTLSFTANGPFSKFVGIRVDGKDVEKANYDAKSGSTIITLEADYLETLTVGEHSLTICYTDGQVNGTFTVKAAQNVPPTTEEEETVPPTTEEEETVPPTTEEEETVPPTTGEEETVPPATEEGEPVPPTTEEEETVPPTTEEEETVPPTTEEEETAPPTTEEEETVPPTTEEEETVPPTTEEEETVPSTTEEGESVPPTTKDEPSATPPTGDDFQPTLWIAMMCMSFGLLVLMKEHRKKHK